MPAPAPSCPEPKPSSDAACEIDVILPASRDFPRLGALTIGAPSTDALALAASAACDEPPLDTNCQLTARNGLEYMTFQDVVWEVWAVASTDAGILEQLPAGVRIGDPFETTLQKLGQESNARWEVGATANGGLTLTSRSWYAHENKFEFVVELRFVDGKLTRFGYTAGSI